MIEKLREIKINRINLKRILGVILSICFCCVLLLKIKPDVLLSPKVTKNYTDFSLAHGEGYVQEGNKFTVTERKSYFIFDLDTLSEDYCGIRLVFEPDGFSKKGSVDVKIGHSISGNMAEEKTVSGTLEKGESVLSLKQDYGTDQYLRISIGMPVGETYVLKAIEIEQLRVSINFWSVLIILLLSCIIYLAAYVVIILLKIFVEKVVPKLERKFDKYALVIALISQIVILCYFIISGHLKFALNDDTLKVSMAGGAYGKPSEYLGYNTIHIFLGWLFKVLFTYLPVINWITVVYLIVQSGAVAGLLILTLRKNRIHGSGVRFLIMEVLLVFYFLALDYFTFTVVAYSAAIFGAVELYEAMHEKEKKHLLAGIAGIVTACLIRPAVCQTIVIVLGVYSVYIAIMKKKIKGIVLCVACVALMKGVQLSNETIVCGSAIEKNFYDWSKIRVEALDAKQVPWEENKEVLEKAGITYDVYNIIYSARYVDIDAVSEQKLQILSNLNKEVDNKYNTNMMDYIKKILGLESRITDIQIVYKILYCFIWVYCLIYYKKRGETAAIGISPILVELIFIFINRDLYRVTMPAYFAALVLMLVNCGKNNDFEKTGKISKGIISGGIVLIWVLLINTFNIEWKNYDYSLANEANQVIAYMEKNQDKLFLPISSDMYSLEVYRPVFEYAGQNGMCYMSGNGETYSEPYYEAMKKYNIKDPDRPILEATDNKDVYIIGTSDIVEAKKLYEPILNYVAEKKGRQLDLMLVKNITDRYSVYRITTK